MVDDVNNSSPPYIPILPSTLYSTILLKCWFIWPCGRGKLTKFYVTNAYVDNWHPSFYVAHKSYHIRLFDRVDDSPHICNKCLEKIVVPNPLSCLSTTHPLFNLLAYHKNRSCRRGVYTVKDSCHIKIACGDEALHNHPHRRCLTLLISQLNG